MTRVFFSSGGKTEDLAKKYFAQLSREQFEWLKNHYKDDLGGEREKRGTRLKANLERKG